MALRVDVALFDDVREDFTDKVSNERADSVAIDETIASRLTIEVDVIIEVDKDDKEFNDDTLDERETWDVLLADADDDGLRLRPLLPLAYDDVADWVLRRVGSDVVLAEL